MGIDFFLSFYINDFKTRLYLFVYFDGVSGIYEPTISVLKSSLINHKIRSTVMNLFRLPRNIFSIILLCVSQFLTTYQICLIVVVFALLTFIFAVYGYHLLEKANYSEKVRKSKVLRRASLNIIFDRKNNFGLTNLDDEEALEQREMLLFGYKKNKN